MISDLEPQTSHFTLHTSHFPRIAITRAEEQAGDLIERLCAHGFDARSFPLIAIAPPDDWAEVDAALARLDDYDTLALTSANAARALAERLPVVAAHFPHSGTQPNSPPSPSPRLPVSQSPNLPVSIAVVGSATAAALAASGLTATLVPATHTAEALAAALQGAGAQRVLILQGDRARPVLRDTLRAAGCTVDTCIVYRTLPGPGAAAFAEAVCRHQLDLVVFTSPSTVEHALTALVTAAPDQPPAHLLEQIALVCIGPTTAQAVRAAGLAVAAIAQPHTNAGIEQAILVLADSR